MTATREVTIWCDGAPGEDRMSCGAWETGERAAEIRAMVKRAGWTTEPGGVDRCSLHSAKEAPQ